MASLKDCLNNNDLAYSLGFTRSFPVVFVSNTDPNAPDFQVNPTYVPNTLDGYLIEFEKTGASASVMGRPSKSNVLPAYSTYLLPVIELDELYNATEVWFDGADFIALDAKVAGSIYQDTDNYNAIINSISSTNYDAWQASRFRNGEVALAGVNFFRPIITINGIPILDMSNTQVKTANGANQIAHQTVGASLPFCLPGGYPVGKINSVNVAAGAAQYISNSISANKIVRYPIICTMNFRLKSNS